MRYRKKPVVIEAMQWDGRDLLELSAFCCKGLVAGGGSYCRIPCMLRSWCI